MDCVSPPQVCLHTHSTEHDISLCGCHSSGGFPCRVRSADSARLSCVGRGSPFTAHGLAQSGESQQVLYQHMYRAYDC